MLFALCPPDNKRLLVKQISYLISCFVHCLVFEENLDSLFSAF